MRAFFWCARQGEPLARDKDVAGDCESEGSPRQSPGLTNRERIRDDASGSGGQRSQSPKLARNDAAHTAPFRRTAGLGWSQRLLRPSPAHRSATGSPRPVQ
ncbi:hypothetical protein E1956_06860 [Paraburkholderia pallida]|uniref:Uncharacterized protein n=1 Tax=Paraburkholderia pallida TaxID=2547399 RepID=A0A4P7CMA1_9BURK|nr:hypothetical protein E1956_06860 [Paraburkholderia pallida]